MAAQDSERSRRVEHVALVLAVCAMALVIVLAAWSHL